MALPQLRHPQNWMIAAGEGALFQGGDQDWYPDPWQRKAGCGPTTAACLLAYLAFSHDLAALGPTDGSQRAFLAHMETLWRYVTPGSRGLEDPQDFLTGGLTFARDRGVALRGRLLRIPGCEAAERPARADCLAFLRASLTQDCPVAFLNYSHGAVKQLDSWHWVPLVALREQDDGSSPVCILDAGSAFWVDFSLWWESSRGGGALVSFLPPLTDGAHCPISP